MASERDRFVADLIKALQANDEFASTGASIAPTLQQPGAAGTRRATTPFGTTVHAAPTNSSVVAASASVRPPSAFTDSEESDSSSREDDTSGGDGDGRGNNINSAQNMFTGLFRESWASSSTATTPGAADVHSQQQRLALEAYERLQFDFPQIADAQLLALAESYRRVAELAAPSNSASLPVTSTLIDGIVYLTEKSGGEVSATTGSDARGLLAASVLLVLVEFCLRHGDQVRARALLRQLHVPSPNAREVREVEPAASVADASSAPLEEKFAIEEDPDDLSQVYEGGTPTCRPQAPVAAASRHVPAIVGAAGAASGAPFVAKLQWLAARTFSSSFAGVSPDAWAAWGLDRALFVIIEQLLLRAEPSVSVTSVVAPPQLYGHPHGEWPRYLYVLRDRVLRFPAAGLTGIETLRDLVRLLQPVAQQWRRADCDAAPHQLVYRVLAELSLSQELQQRAAQPAQRALAAAVQSLLPLVVQELERLAAALRATTREANTDATAAVESDSDLVLILVQLTHALLAAAPSKRAAAETLQTSGTLRALLALVPADAGAPEPAHERQWFAPLLRLVAECALWSADWAAYAARVPKVVALLPALHIHTQRRAELALLLVALHQHELQMVATNALNSVGVGAGRSLWDAIVADALFPRACSSYLDAMQQLQDAIYFLECVGDALAELRPRVLDELRASLQRAYPSFSQAFAYPSLAAAPATASESQALAAPTASSGDRDGDDNDDREERGAAEALQFLALRNKLRQSAKSVLLRSGSFGAGLRASSKLD